MGKVSGERFNKVILVVGGRGTGKTTFARDLFDLYDKVLVLDTIDHPSYRDLGEITPEQLPRWKRGRKRMFRADPRDLLTAVERHVHNCLILFEDSRKYIRRTVPDEIERMITDSKQKNNDIIFLYHSLNMVPPFVYNMIDFLTIFYTNEEMGSHLKTKVPQFSHVRETHERVKKIAEQGRGSKRKADPRSFYNETIEIGA